MVLKDSVDKENECLDMVLLDEEGLIEDKKRQGAEGLLYTHQNPKKHILLVSLLLWHKNGGHALLHLASSYSLAIVVSQAARQ